MDLNNKKNKLFTKWIIVISSVLILIYLGIQNLNVVARAILWIFDLVMPLLLGLVFALILNVPMNFIESHLWRKTKKEFFQKLRRPISLILSIVLIIDVLIGIVWLVIPEVVEAIRLVVETISKLISKLASMSREELTQIPFGNVLVNTDWDEILKSLQTWLRERGGSIMNTAMGTIGSVVGGVFNFIISLIFSVYILSNKEKLKKQACRLIRAWLPKRFGEWFIHASHIASGNFRNFVSGQSIEAVILGTLCMIGMFILGLPYAPMIGALVGVTALIPVVGGFIGAIVGAFMILTISPIKALIFVLFILILQQLEGNLIYPKVMGSRVNLPAMWILAAVTIGGGLAGPVGMLLAVPVASTVYFLVREATEKREEEMCINCSCNEIK